MSKFTEDDYRIDHYLGDEEGAPNHDGNTHWAVCEQLGCRVEGTTVEDALALCKKAMKAMLEAKDEMGFDRPIPEAKINFQAVTSTLVECLVAGLYQDMMAHKAGNYCAFQLRGPKGLRFLALFTRLPDGKTPMEMHAEAMEMLKRAYCREIGTDTTHGLDSCDNFKQWLEGLRGQDV